MTGGKLIRQVGALLVVALCATACTDTDSADPPKKTGSSVTSVSSTPATTTAQPGSGPSSRPPITRPLSASPYFNETMICDLFTDAQAAELGFDGMKFPSELEHSAYCSRDTGSGGRPFVQLKTIYYPIDLLQIVYKQGNPSERQPTVIVGQPAAIITPRRGSPLACSVVIGISAEQGVEVEIFASDDAVQRCDLAVSIATTIVHNLGG